MSTVVRVLLWTFAIIGVAFEYLIFGFGLVVLAITCRLGWHSWDWDYCLRVPYYGTGAWRCETCGKVKVKPLDC